MATRHLTLKVSLVCMMEWNRVSQAESDEAAKHPDTSAQTHLRRCLSKKANTSGSQMFTPRKGKACPSSGVRPIGG